MAEGQDIPSPSKSESLKSKFNIFFKSAHNSQPSKLISADQHQINTEIGQIKKEIVKLDTENATSQLPDQKSEAETIEEQKINQYVKAYGSFKDKSFYIETPPPELSSSYHDRLKSDFSLRFERLKETIFLKKNGVSNPKTAADFFLSRGLKTDFISFLKDSNFNINNYITGINRLQSIGLSGEYFMTKDFVNKDKENNLINSFKNISELSDSDFQKYFSNSNQYFFFKDSNAYESAQSFDRDNRNISVMVDSYRFTIDLFSNNLPQDNIDGLNLIKNNIFLSSNVLTKYQIGEFIERRYSNGVYSDTSIKNTDNLISEHAVSRTNFPIDNNYLFSHLDFFTKNLNTISNNGYQTSLRENVVNNILNYFQTDRDKKIENITDPEIKKIWSNLLKLPDKHFIETFSNSSNCKNIDQFFDKNGNITSFFLKNYMNGYGNITSFSLKNYMNGFRHPFIKSDIEQVVSNFPPEDQRFWNIYLNSFSKDDNLARGILLSFKDDYQNYFNDNIPKSNFYEKAYMSGIFLPLTDEIINNFSSKDKIFWNTIKDLSTNKGLIKLLIDNKKDFDSFYSEGSFTKVFFNFFKENDQIGYEQYFFKTAIKKDWETVFGRDIITNLLNSLPAKTDEKRNAFTHNEYDRTSKFFEYLSIHRESGFELNQDNLLLATDYIKSFGLSKAPLIFKYFKDISNFEQGKLDTLPQICLDSNIKTIDQLVNEVNSVRQLCLSRDQIKDLSDLSPLQIDMLSVVTGHASNRWTKIPIKTIIEDFSQDLKSGSISPLPPEFTVSTAKIEKTKTVNTVDLNKNKIYQQASQEILNSISNIETIDDLKKAMSDILDKKIDQLSNKNNNQFIEKQITTFKNTKNNLNDSDSVDNMISILLASNLNFGHQEQGEYNSILRQLVYRKTFIKHQSPEFIEGLRISLENNPGPDAIFNILNFLNNIVKDHTLNFQANNNEQYWDQETFSTIKKYEKVFKKNLNISSFTKEMQDISSQFEIIKSDSTLNIDMIPDRGLIGEMAGYMADVCYTKVYPLLKQYPDLVPYKFVSRAEDDISELIGSTLVFKVDTQDNQPALLIRAFDIPQEHSLDIPSFFEKFVDSLSESAKKMGIKKIIAAGTPGTISNYSVTTNYVLSHYVNSQSNIPLKEHFGFNGYDITNQCYLVRNLDNN